MELTSISVFEVIYKTSAMIKAFAPPNQAPFLVNECHSGQSDPPNQAQVKWVSRLPVSLPTGKPSRIEVEWEISSSGSAASQPL